MALVGAERLGGSHLVECLRQDIMAREPWSFKHKYLFERFSVADCLYSTDLRGHFSCVNALCFSHLGHEYLASGGDDERILIWKMRSLLDRQTNHTPVVMSTKHDSNIFSMEFTCDNNYIISAGNDGVIIAHNLHDGDAIRSYQHTSPIYCVDTHPFSSQIFAAATEDGSIFIIDSREPRLTQSMILDDSIHAYHSISINPLDPQFIVAGNEFTGAGLFDLRSWKKVFTYNFSSWPLRKSDTDSVCFNSDGSKVFVMQRSLPPCVFKSLSQEPEFCCVDDGGTYRNTVTMKSGCFAGERDEYVVSGSDDFCIYWWKLPHKTDGRREQIIPHLVIPGHRSIVNQTRFSSVHYTLCSSGVEKVVKIWTPIPLNHNHTPNYSRASPIREHYTEADIIDMGYSLLDEDPEEDNVEENERVLAFFDQLIDEEEDTENLSSDEDLHINSDDEDLEGHRRDIGPHLEPFFRRQPSDLHNELYQFRSRHTGLEVEESSSDTSHTHSMLSEERRSSPRFTPDEAYLEMEEEEEEDELISGGSVIYFLNNLSEGEASKIPKKTSSNVKRKRSRDNDGKDIVALEKVIKNSSLSDEEVDKDNIEDIKSSNNGCITESHSKARQATSSGISHTTLIIETSSFSYDRHPKSSRHFSSRVLTSTSHRDNLDFLTNFFSANYRSDDTKESCNQHSDTNTQQTCSGNSIDNGRSISECRTKKDSVILEDSVNSLEKTEDDSVILEHSLKSLEGTDDPLILQDALDRTEDDPVILEHPLEGTDDPLILEDPLDKMEDGLDNY